MKKRNRIIAVSVIVLICVLFLIIRGLYGQTSRNAAAGTERKEHISKTEETRAEDGTLEHANIRLCLIGTAPADMDMVLEQLNKMTERDLACSVSVDWINWGEFSTRYPIVLSSGPDIDLIYAANWLDFYANAKRGAFAPLDELLEQYAPESLKELNDTARKQATVNGTLYALPANYTNYNVLGVIARGDLMDKYQLGDIRTFDDYLNFCDVMAAQENIDPTGMCANNTDMSTMYAMSLGYYPVTGTTVSPYWTRLDDPDYPVYFQSECPGMEDYLSRAEEWYKKGYWSADVLSSKDETLLNSGLAASRIHNYDAYMGAYGVNEGRDLRYYNLAQPVVRQSYIQDAMAVPASSRNKERAVMLLEKFRTDEEYYMLITYGIEGYHYKITQDGDIRKIEFLNRNYGNEPGTWGFREERFKCYDSVLPEIALEHRKDYEEQAVDTDIVNFNADLTEIATEYEQVRQVMSVYYNPLKLGYTDYEEGKKQLDEQLLAAGNEKVKEELSRQLREFMKQN